ncbi:MAG TPA: excalibur calcium-binding domain-containing protein [Nakamurella sp.]|nr:excalibur calcium-binding domain-containing protein [Nakamurella sp.]
MPVRTRPRGIASMLGGVVLAWIVVVGTALPAGAVPPPPDNPSDDQIQAGQGQVATSAAEVGRLSGLVSKTEGDIERLKNDMELKAELANKAAVDLQVAQSDAAAASAFATAAQSDADAAGKAIDDAKAKAASFAAASFRQGSVLGSMTALLDSGSATDLLQRRELLEQVSGTQLNAIANLESTRNHKANLDSAARAALDVANAAQARADQAKKDADTAQQRAADSLAAGQDQLTALEGQLTQQQNDYHAALSNVAGLQQQRDQYNQWLAQKQAEEEAARKAAEEAARQAAAAAAAEAARQAAEAAAARAAAQAAAEEAAGQQAAEQEAAAERESAAQEAGNQAARAAQQAAASSEPFYDSCDDARAAGRGPISQGEPGYRSALDPNGNGVACEGTVAVADAAANISAPTSDSVYYDSCDAARAAGQGPIARGEPGYRSALDPNGNGTACEGVAATTPVSTAVRTVGSFSSSDSSGGQQVVDAAMAYLGTTYAWGGGDYSGPSQGIHDGGVADRYGDYNKVGFDCSGLALYAWAQVGVYLPHYSGYQYTGQPHVSRSDLQPGDLVFYAYDTSDPSSIHHVAIWIGNNQIVEAPNSGSYVRISTMYWNGFIGAARPAG